MRKATVKEQLDDFIRDDVSSSDPEFYDLWVCKCGHRYRDLVDEQARQY